MEKKELALEFLKNPKPYNAYQKGDIEMIEQCLESCNLSPMERRSLEVIYKNCMFLQEHSFDSRTRHLEEEARHELRQRKIEQMKQEKEKKLHFRKLVVRAGIIGLLAVGGATGLKLHHDAKVKAVTIVRENYDYMVTTITVKEGQNITLIATDIYNNLPDDVKKIKSVDDIKNEICRMNAITNPHHIEPGWILNIPYYELKEKLEELKVY